MGISKYLLSLDRLAATQQTYIDKVHNYPQYAVLQHVGVSVSSSLNAVNSLLIQESKPSIVSETAHTPRLHLQAASCKSLSTSLCQHLTFSIFLKEDSEKCCYKSKQAARKVSYLQKGRSFYMVCCHMVKQS